MTQQSVALIDHPEINVLLQDLLSRARGILGDHFVGMYLDGSLAIGDFDPNKSDLDFVVVTDSEVSTAGPLPQTLIDPVQPEELREAVRGVLREWWMPMLIDGPLLQNSFYRCYAVLTMSRMLYTMRHGAIVTKPSAARWAQGALDRRWTPLIQQALAWSRDAPPDLEETLAYIRHTCEYSDQFGVDVEPDDTAHHHDAER